MGSAIDSPGLVATGDTAAPPPPGASAAAAALDGAGVPLGTTELFVGGLSPSPTDLGGSCPERHRHGLRSEPARSSAATELCRSSPSDLGGAIDGEFHRVQPCAHGRGRTVGTVIDHGSRDDFRRRKHSARGDGASDHRARRHDRSARKHYALQLYGRLRPDIPASEPPPRVRTGRRNPGRAGVLRPPPAVVLMRPIRCGQADADNLMRTIVGRHARLPAHGGCIDPPAVVGTRFR